MSFPAAWKRSFVAAVVHPQELIVAPGKAAGASEWINLEQFNPFRDLTFDAQSGAQFDLMTHVPRLAPEDLPSTALGYAIFDLLFIEGEGFARLRPKQLAAIGDWTAAGGSLVVAPSGKMSAEHVGFLNRIAGLEAPGEGGPHANPAAYSLSEDRQLVIGERTPAGAKFVYDHCGLGRSLVIHERLDPEVDFDAAEWKAAVAFLWKVRKTQVGQILQKGKWAAPAQQNQGRPAVFRPYKPQPDDLPRNIREFLLPERIEGVPLWVVVIILSLYLVVIAPGDYFLLGRLNSRKYTWVFFALISAAFTGSTVMIAESYMGHADYRTTLVFADLVDGGNITGGNNVTNGSSPELPPGAEADHTAVLARVSRFEMLFAATQRQIEIPAQSELYVDITDRALVPSASHKDHHSFVFADDEDTDVIEAVAADMPVYAGLMPGSFTIEQQMRQWSPRVNRRTSLGNDPELAAETTIDWKALRPDGWATPEGRETLREAVLSKEPAARAWLFHETVCFDLNAIGAQEQTPAKWLSDSRISALVQSASVRPASGLFTAVSQISPTGGENLEDLALLDSSDSRQWLLAVAVHRDNNWLVFRKLYRGSQP